LVFFLYSAFLSSSLQSRLSSFANKFSFELSEVFEQNNEQLQPAIGIMYVTTNYGTIAAADDLLQGPLLLHDCVKYFQNDTKADQSHSLQTSAG